MELDGTLYQHRCDIRSQEYRLFWSLDSHQKSISIGIDSEAAGWVGIGFGKGHNAVDMVVAAYGTVTDFWSSTKGNLASDIAIGGRDDLIRINDTTVVKMHQGRGIVKFKRMLNTSEWDWLHGFCDHL